MKAAARVSTVYLLGFGLDLVNMFACNVALPRIGADLQAGAALLTWVTAAYTLGLTVVIPAAPGLARAWGQRRLLLGSMAAFALLAALSAASPSIGVLIPLRFFQGVAGGVLIPIGQAWAYRLTPAHDRHSLTTRIMAIALFVPALSPVVSGYLVESLSWRALLAASMPVALVVLGLAYAWLPKDSSPIAHRPLLPAIPALLRSRALRVPMLIYVLVPGVFVGINVVAAMDLSARRFTPAAIGLLMLPWSMASAIGIWTTRRLFNVVGPRVLLVIGSGTQAAGIVLLMLARSGNNVTPLVSYALMGFGGSLCSSAAQTLAFREVASTDMLSASALWNINRQFAFFIGPLALGTTLSLAQDPAIVYGLAAIVTLASWLALRTPFMTPTGDAP